MRIVIDLDGMWAIIEFKSEEEMKKAIPELVKLAKKF